MGWGGFLRLRQDLKMNAWAQHHVGLKANVEQYVHMFEVKMSVSRPWRTSPLKYDAKGPCPVESFCRAM